jgi:phosphoribosyl-ATP pyrophosphohydrolase
MEAVPYRVNCIAVDSVGRYTYCEACSGRIREDEPVNEPQSIFTQLMATIEARRANPPPNSYTARLFEGGVKKIRTKIVEEAAELFEAAAEPAAEGRTHVVYEAADLVYHLLVLLAHHGIPLTDLEQELARRFGTSGLDEKASRGRPQ